MSFKPGSKPKRKIPSASFAQRRGDKKVKIERRPRVDKAKPMSPSAASPGESATMQTTGLPECFWQLGFETLPTEADVRQRYRELSFVLHPDTRGSTRDFQELRLAYEQAMEYLKIQSE